MRCGLFEHTAGRGGRAAGTGIARLRSQLGDVGRGWVGFAAVWGKSVGPEGPPTRARPPAVAASGRALVGGASAPTPFGRVAAIRNDSLGPEGPCRCPRPVHCAQLSISPSWNGPIRCLSRRPSAPTSTL
ncbi:DUF6053 domain-containing protein [Lysobacter enzymogenes]|uniref:DUF6053 domain-containing protein n=1 Tax=Lysobacter enzymogenes TaxID=69 RepID=UPI0037492D46